MTRIRWTMETDADGDERYVLSTWIAGVLTDVGYCVRIPDGRYSIALALNDTSYADGEHETLDRAQRALVRCAAKAFADAAAALSAEAAT